MRDCALVWMRLPPKSLTLYTPLHLSQRTDGRRVFHYQIPHNAQTYNRPMSQAYEDALVIKVFAGTIALSMGRILADLRL